MGNIYGSQLVLSNLDEIRYSYRTETSLWESKRTVSIGHIQTMKKM